MIASVLASAVAAFMLLSRLRHAGTAVSDEDDDINGM
jgi:hypothetical protein